MAALKRFSIALVLMGLVLSVAPLAQAQFSFPVQPLGRIVCTYSAVPNQVRAEGLAERVGDARLDCVNDGQYNPNSQNNNMQQYVLANITLSLNTAVTNRLDVGDDGNSRTTDSVMTINDNNHYRPIATSELPDSNGDACSSTGGNFSVPDERYPCPMKGEYLANRSLVWDGVRFPVPGAPNDPDNLPDDDGPNPGVPFCDDIFDQDSDDSCFNVTTTIRITNIRGNAAAVGEGGAILGTLTIFSFAGISVTPTNQQTWRTSSKASSRTSATRSLVCSARSSTERSRLPWRRALPAPSRHWVRQASFRAISPRRMAIPSWRIPANRRQTRERAVAPRRQHAS